MDSPSEVDVSAIVIARNEELRIEATLRSVIENLREARTAGACGGTEVLLVDSASTDRTVEIARRHGVTVVQMPGDWPLSAPAGRYTGLLHARGRRLLMADGDCVLAPGFLRAALPHLKGDVAVVCGRETEHALDGSLLARKLAEAADAESAREPEAIPNGVYRRDALDKAGATFEPFLRAGEDREVARRLRAAGFRLLRLPLRMTEHFWGDEADRLTYVVYFRSVATWSFGDGQVARSLVSGSARRALLRRYFRARQLIEYGTGLALGATLGAIASPLASPAAWPLAVLGGAGLAGVLLLRKRKRSWRELGYELHGIPYTLIRHAGLLVGMLQGSRPASEYPRGAAVIPGSGQETS